MWICQGPQAWMQWGLDKQILKITCKFDCNISTSKLQLCSLPCSHMEVTIQWHPLITTFKNGVQPIICLERSVGSRQGVDAHLWSQGSFSAEVYPDLPIATSWGELFGSLFSRSEGTLTCFSLYTCKLTDQSFWMWFSCTGLLNSCTQEISLQAWFYKFRINL